MYELCEPWAQGRSMHELCEPWAQGRSIHELCNNCPPMGRQKIDQRAVRELPPLGEEKIDPPAGRSGGVRGGSDSPSRPVAQAGQPTEGL